MLDRKIKSAKSAIDDIFSDTSVNAEETLDALKELRDEIEMKIEVIEADLEAG